MQRDFFSETVFALATAAEAGSISKERCQTLDWQQAGVKDARKGRPKSRIDGLARRCTEHGVSIDTAAYTAGYDSQIMAKCQPENGYKRGLKGDPKANACAGAGYTAYGRAHEQGKAVRKERVAAREAMERLDRQIDELEAQSAALDSLSSRLDSDGFLPDPMDSAAAGQLMERLGQERALLAATRDSYASYLHRLEATTYGYLPPERPQLVAKSRQCEPLVYSGLR